MKIPTISAAICALSLCLTMSCGRSGIVSDAPVRLARPNKTVTLKADETFNCTFPEVLNCVRAQIVNDTILVFQDQVGENNGYHFKAYSTNGFSYLGEFIRKGRGPGEMLFPHIARSSGKFLALNDNSTGQAWMVDVTESISSHTTSIVQSYDLPGNITDWLPLDNSEQFLQQLENGELAFHTTGSDGKIHKTFNLFSGIDGDRCLTHLSSILVNNGYSGMVAEIMVLFPQINFIDTESGKVHSVAVNRDYKKWESVINTMINMDFLEYYVAGAADSDYILAAFRGRPLKTMNDEGVGSSIHILDWNGNFLYEISVDENINYMTYDSATKYLYCIAKPYNSVVRYDLREFLEN